jgi:hypothetical protein
MLSQLLQLLSAQRDKLACSRRRVRRTFRGRFEQLEARAMLTATIEMPSTSPGDESLSVVVPDIYFVLVTDELVVPPPPVAATSGDPEMPPHFVGFPLPPQSPSQVLGRLRAKDVLSADHPLQPSAVPAKDITFISNSAAAQQAQDIVESNGYGTYLLKLAGIGGIGEYSLFVFSPEPHSERLNSRPDPGNSVGKEAGSGNQEPLEDLSPHNVGIASDGGGRLVNSSNDLLQSSLPVACQGDSSAAVSQRAYDSVFQSYVDGSGSLTLDQADASQLALSSLTKPRSDANGGQGGFVELDGSDSLDGTASRPATDAKRDAIDAVLADFMGLDSSLSGDSYSDSIEANSSGIAADDDASATLGGAEGLAGDAQGGMVMLRSGMSGGDLVSLAGPVDASINWSVPTANGKLEATVGIYQAFDVATGDLTLAAAAAKHEHEAKKHVSADKVAKPTADQASVWVEMFTAAAVIGGTSKKQRKSRKQA